MSKIVSILIPVYKSERYIEECLRSVFEQTYENIEYILINDATPDNSMAIVYKIIEKYPNRKPFVKIFENEINQGVAYTRNLLINNAIGDYIYFVDSDDFIDKNAVETLLLTAEKEQADIARCNYYKYKDGKNKAIIRKDYKYKDKIQDCLSNDVGMTSLWLLLIRRSLFTRNGLSFPSNINGCEDFLMTIKLFYYANKIADTPNVLYYYRLDNCNSITQQESIFRSDSCNAINEIMLFLKEKKIYDQYNNLCLRLKFTAKQHFLINKSIRDIDKYISTFPESNSYYKQLPYSKKQKLMFFLAEHNQTTLLRLLFKLF